MPRSRTTSSTLSRFSSRSELSDPTRPRVTERPPSILPNSTMHDDLRFGAFCQDSIKRMPTFGQWAVGLHGPRRNTPGLAADLVRALTIGRRGGAELPAHHGPPGRCIRAPASAFPPRTRARRARSSNGRLLRRCIRRCSRPGAVAQTRKFVCGPQLAAGPVRRNQGFDGGGMRNVGHSVGFTSSLDPDETAL